MRWRPQGSTPPSTGRSPHLKPNHHLYLKSHAEMERLFAERPEAVSNTLRIAERCGFDLASDLGYKLSEPDVPTGYTPQSLLERLCREAATATVRRLSPRRSSPALRRSSS